MAGIGFELKKVISKESIGSFFKASISGVFIVAGPWLLSMLSLGLISVLSSGSLVLESIFSILVYIFSISLIISGGFHYLYTRLFSDYLYNKEEGKALFFTLCYMLLSLCLTPLLTLIFISIIVGLQNISISLVMAIIFQAIVVNQLWIILIFISSLKWYVSILVCFLVGISIMVLLILIWGSESVNTILNSYSIGNFITIVALISLSVSRFKPEIITLRKMLDTVILYWKEYKLLFFTGLFYNLALWIDKILNWLLYGFQTGELGLKLLFSYDFSMYIANLSIIPGLIFYVISSETDYFLSVKKFLLSLVKCDYKDINTYKNDLISTAKKGLAEQTYSQFFITLALSLLSFYIIPEQFHILLISLWSVFMQLILFSYMNFLFYMGRYRYSFYIVLITTVTNVLVYMFVELSPLIQVPGVSYFVANLIGSLYARRVFIYNASRLERFIYTKNI